ncbi:hypothetical protein H4R19_004307, partial [Coemansia spiralis]
ASNGTRDLVSRLPFDLAILVAERLSPRDLYTCWTVCRGWQRLFTSDSILLPVFTQLSHFDQESFMFQCLPSGHGHDDSDHKKAAGGESTAGRGGDGERSKFDEEMKIEERACQQWLKNSRVLVRVMQNLLNRAQRWKDARPTTRIYLPPVPMDGTDADIRDEWQGSVKLVKLKAGVVAVLYEEGRSIRLWTLESGYDKVKEMTREYIAANRAALEEQADNGGPQLPPFSDEQVESLLRHSRSGTPRPSALKTVRMRVKPSFFDFFESNKTLVTATHDGVVDVYDMGSGQHRRTLTLTSDSNVESLHVWLDYVVVSHGTQITLWNHTTGALLEDALQTAHRASITGVFVLDNDRHLLSIDRDGILVATNRDAGEPQSETLLDVPLYPVVLAGQMGAPYSMRLLHMTHLCVWGKYSLGHYEMYEPGLRSLPPLSSLVLPPPGEEEPPRAPGEATDAPPEPQMEAQTEPPTEPPTEPQVEPSNKHVTRGVRYKTDEERRLAEAREALAHLESAHENLEHMYSQMVGNRDDEHPEGDRMERFRQMRVPAEQRYHVLNIDTPFEQISDGRVLSVDFKHALFLRTHFMQICDLEARAAPGEEPNGQSLGLFPVDWVPPTQGPSLPPPPASEAASNRNPAARRREESGNHNTDDDYDDFDYYENMEEEYEDYGYDSDAEGFPGFDDEIEEDEEEGEDDLDGPYEDVGAGRVNEEFYFEWSMNSELAMMGGDRGRPQPSDEPAAEAPRAPPGPPDLQKATLLELEALVMRYILGLRFAREDRNFGRVEFNRVHLGYAREVMSRHLPELYQAIENNVSIEAVAEVAPYFIQRAYEARFAVPVLNVNHRGQSVPSQRLVKDMERVYRAARIEDRTYPAASARLLPLAVVDLACCSAAMDDGRIAIG